MERKLVIIDNINNHHRLNRLTITQDEARLKIAKNTSSDERQIFIDNTLKLMDAISKIDSITYSLRGNPCSFKDNLYYVALYKKNHKHKSLEYSYSSLNGLKIIKKES